MQGEVRCFGIVDDIIQRSEEKLGILIEPLVKENVNTDEQ